jgi:DHA2 family multidrug resistance protein
MVDQQAALLSANDIFYASALLFLAMIGLVWLSKPAKAAASAEAAGAH